MVNVLVSSLVATFLLWGRALLEQNQRQGRGVIHSSMNLSPSMWAQIKWLQTKITPQADPWFNDACIKETFDTTNNDSWLHDRPCDNSKRHSHLFEGPCSLLHCNAPIPI